MCLQHFCFDVNNRFQNVSKMSLAEAMQGSLQCLSLENNASDGTDRPLISIQEIKAPDSQRGMQYLPTTIVGAFTVPYYLQMSREPPKPVFHYDCVLFILCWLFSLHK